MSTKQPVVIAAHAGLGDRKHYLTGKVRNWLSHNIDDAYKYNDELFATTACKALNANTVDDRLRGLVFSVQPYEAPADPVDSLGADAEAVQPPYSLPHFPVACNYTTRVQDLPDGGHRHIVVINDETTGECVTMAVPTSGDLHELKGILHRCNILNQEG